MGIFFDLKKLSQIMTRNKITYLLFTTKLVYSFYGSEPEKKCVAIDPRVDDQWCIDDCLCDFCPGCNEGNCHGFCDWEEPACVAIDPRVDDEWCQLDCMCDWCPGCNQDYCAGFCDYEWDDPEPPTEAPPTQDPSIPTTQATTTTRMPKPDNPDDRPCDSSFERNVIYVDYKVNWDDLSSDIKNCIDACFNVVMLSFYIGTEKKPMDAIIT